MTICSVAPKIKQAKKAKYTVPQFYPYVRIE
jgi:hypothetical protein